MKDVPEVDATLPNFGLSDTISPTFSCVQGYFTSEVIDPSTATEQQQVNAVLSCADYTTVSDCAENCVSEDYFAAKHRKDAISNEATHKGLRAPSCR
eukprot:SAG31_NODE_19550_length_599_cov_0.716000_1_plen_97_part_10